MRTYNVIDDFDAQAGTDRVQVSGHCILAIFRHRYPVTYSRKKKGSVSQDPMLTVEMRPKIIVVDDIMNVTVSGNKGNHIKMLGASLYPGRNYVVDVTTGDFIFAWMVQKEDDFKRLLARLDGEPDELVACNGFMDGLKFFGRIAGVRKRIQVNPNTGSKIGTYQISASGFNELDAQLYFEPQLQLRQVGILTSWLQNYGIRLNEIIKNNGNGISTNGILPELLSMFFGTGAPQNHGVPPVGNDKNEKNDRAPINLTKGTDNPYSYIIPREVAEIFGVSNGSKPHGLVSYIDILECTHGIQKYTGEYTNDRTTPVGTIFNPDSVRDKSGFRYTRNELLGTFLPSVPSLAGSKSAMSLIQQYVNPVVNETYTAMRPNPSGRVFPTLIVRQLPFSTELADNSKSILTYFKELPRWIIDPILINNLDIGRSDALRFNFIHIMPEVGAKSGLNPTQNFVRSPPIADDLDISQNGFRPYMRTVPCGPQDLVNGARDWADIISDIVMGGHLALTGTLETVGIQAPIDIGDNIELDDVLYHIEGITHSFSVNGSTGVGKFVTSFALSHGVSVSDAANDVEIFAGIESDSLSTFDPTITTQSARPEVVEKDPITRSQDTSLQNAVDDTDNSGRA